jgi:ribosomal protein S18 acetylase RimI-like enzyme
VIRAARGAEGEDRAERLAIGPLEARELEATALALARAFRDNPLNLAVIGAGDPARRLRCNLHGFRASLPVALAHARVLVARSGGRPCAALVAVPAGAWPLPPPPWAAQLRCLLGQGFGVARRWSRVFAALAALHPREPHWYLATLGVDPDHQARGRGRRLLEAWLGTAAGDRLPAYLETDRPENLAFYAGAGFALVREARILGVPVWCMRRRASPG